MTTEALTRLHAMANDSGAIPYDRTTARMAIQAIGALSAGLPPAMVPEPGSYAPACPQCDWHTWRREGVSGIACAWCGNEAAAVPA